MRLHRRPGDPRPRRGRPARPRATRPAPPLRELVERAIAGQGRRRRRGPAASPGLREILNYGHTLGARRSSRSSATGGGTARRSSVGLVFAAELARLAGPARRRHRRPAPQRPRAALGLPTELPTATRWPTLLDAMRGRQEGPRRPSCGSSCSTALARPADPGRPGPGAAGRGVRGGRAMSAAVTSRGARPQRPQPRPARHAASRRSTARRRYDELVGAVRERRAPSSASRSRCARPTHEGELLDWLHEAADAGTPVVLNAGAPGPTTRYALRDACAQLHRAAGRGAHLQPRTPARSSGTPRWSPASPPAPSPASARTPTCWPCGRWWPERPPAAPGARGVRGAHGAKPRASAAAPITIASASIRSFHGRTGGPVRADRRGRHVTGTPGVRRAPRPPVRGRGS